MIGLNRFQDDLQNGLLEADYIVVEMAKQMLGDNWMADYVQVANAGGIDRVLVSQHGRSSTSHPEPLGHCVAQRVQGA
jgi:hypothetical protein